ncbi:hypothetical protein Wcon_00639 [Wolbachia endosymbiont of Cylisticus convexus]|uniref:hypothetical protein n=1 Tax=Wolbachia endosymbiont of Cylisticus convexus TaxID=118728 RepID=UPI000DF67ABB|nr:hypothetical protein [Wolbachia endosymbiont of Cylisticus convexus]RDD35215.1 hypothetical protein Wcon_00639 [Wolbachia endosymbiont of Cylisticus convexus]
MTLIFFTSWYNKSSKIFKEISRTSLEKRVLNVALAFLMLPYVALTALGLVLYSRYKINDKTQISVEENKKKENKLTAKRLAYGILASVVIFATFVILLIPATIALAIFYLLNRGLVHSLIAAFKEGSESYQNQHPNIEVSFHGTEVNKSDIMLDIEIKFPPQFAQLREDLYKNKNGGWINVGQDPEHNTILKSSVKIHLGSGLKPLRSEITNVLKISVQGFTKTMEELMNLEKAGITYNKLKELLTEFKLKVVNSVDSKLISCLIPGEVFIQPFKEIIDVVEKLPASIKPSILLPDGEKIFKDLILPRIRDKLYEVFSENIELTLVRSELDEVNVTQQNQETVITA